VNMKFNTGFRFIFSMQPVRVQMIPSLRQYSILSTPLILDTDTDTRMANVSMSFRLSRLDAGDDTAKANRLNIGGAAAARLGQLD
jgi:hypothetical protein